MHRLIWTLLTCLLIAGCAPKSTFVLLPDLNGQVGKIIVTNSRGTQTLDQARQSVVIKGKTNSPGKVKSMGETEIYSLFGKALDIQPLLRSTLIAGHQPRFFHGSLQKITMFQQVDTN